MKEKSYSQIRYWVEDLPRNGRRTFSLDDAIRQFPQKRLTDIKNALSRLARAGKVQSVWRGFYAIVLPEYGNRGIIPPTEYIGQLMSFLGNEYYIALLSAAQHWGAAHHAPQVFQFICDKPLRNKVKNYIELEPVMKKNISPVYLVTVNARSGGVRVSSPELTVVDLLLYPHRAGGLNNIATVIDDMTGILDFSKVEPYFFEGVPPAVIQRLGFLLEDVADEAEIADLLFLKAEEAGLTFRNTPLNPAIQRAAQSPSFNKRWKVVVNTNVEAD